MSMASKLRQLGKVVRDRRWLPFYFQRRFMAARRRERLADFVARYRRPALGDAVNNIIAAERARTLAAAGIHHLGNLLTSQQADELRQYFGTKLVHDPYRGGATFLPDSAERHPHAHIAHHNPMDVLLAPYLFELVNRPDIVDVAARFLGCRPTLGYLAAWWSYPTELGAQQAEHFHRDVDDWRFLKLFIYLTDVGPDNGPHVYVSRSAPSEALREIRRFSDEEVRQAFGADSILSICGHAGEGFLENTFGVHKGQPVAAGVRLILQAVYSMSPLPYGPLKPVLDWQRLREVHGSVAADAWINRLYVQQP